MRMTALLTTVVVLFIATAAHADPFAKADPKAGRNLLNEANCNACHAQRMGGDASRMYTRPERKVRDAQGLLKMVQFCVDRTGATVFPEDVVHMAAYLNQQFYKFEK
jgi:cytochrome c peroxidase